MSRYAEDYESAPMFNVDLKEQYIAERINEVVMPPNYLHCQFGKIAEMETELNKDCSCFTMYEIEEYYKLLNSSSYEGLTVLNSQLSLYTQWCLQNNLVVDNQNHYLEMTIEKIQGCVNKALFKMKFVTRETVLQWCEQLPNPKDQFVLLGLFEGLKGKDFCELWKLKPEDINGNIVKLCTGREIKLSNKLISIIEDCISEDTYYSTSGKGVKVMPLVDKGYIVKDYPNTKDDVSDFQCGRKIYNGITRTLNYFGVLDVMSANSITESGKLEMIKELAKEHNMTNKEFIYSPYISDVEEKYNCKIVRSIYVIKYEDCLL